MAYMRPYGAIPRGDPSFLGGLISGIGSVVHSVASVAGSILPGPLGVVARGVSAVTGGGGGGPVIQTLPQGSSGYGIGGAVATPVGTAGGGFVRFTSGGTMPGGAQIGGGYGGDIAGKIYAKQRGTHVNKSTYVTRRGGQLVLHPKGTGLVSNRRMNPGNGRAIRRAVRRLKAGERMFRQVFTVLHGKRPHGIKPKRRGRR